MFNINRFLSRKGDANKSPSRSQSLISGNSDGGVENEGSSSAEGFLCPSCYSAFPTDEHLKNHYESAHPESSTGGIGQSGSFICPACKMKFASENECDSHYERHHLMKDDNELEILRAQVQALTEREILLQKELQMSHSQSLEHIKDKSKLLEERNAFELQAARLSGELANLKAEFDEVSSKKKSLEVFRKDATEKIDRLEAELQQRLAADDVKVLKEEYVSVQKLMNEKTLKLEDEKDELQQQVEKLQKICSDLEKKYTELENVTRDSPTKAHVENLDNELKEISSGYSEMQNNLSLKNIELTAMQEKYLTSEEDNKKLQQDVSALQELVRSSKDRIETLEKSEIELKSLKKHVEQLQVDREKLFAKIENGEGTNAAMKQLEEENYRLHEKIFREQSDHIEQAHRLKDEINSLRSSLENESSALKDAVAQCGGYKETNDKLISQLQALMEDKQKMLQLKEKFTTERKMYEGEIKNLESCMQVAKKFFETKFGDSLDVQIQSEGTDTSVNKDKTSELGLAFKALSLKMESDKIKLSRNKEKIERLTKKFTEASEESNSLHLKNKDLQQRCVELTQDMKCKEKSYTELGEDLESVVISNEDLRMRIESLTKELTDVKENSQQLLEDTQEELAKCQKRLMEVDEQLDISLKDQSTVISTYTSKLQLIKEETDAQYKGKIDDLNDQISQLGGEIEKLEKQHTQDMTELKNAHTQISELGKQHVLEEQKLKSDVAKHKLNESEMNKKYKEMKELFENSEKCRATSVESLANTQKVLQEKILQFQNNEEEFQSAKNILVTQKLEQLKEFEAMKLDFENKLAEVMRRYQDVENTYRDLSLVKQITDEQLEKTEVDYKNLKENADRAASNYEAQIGILETTVKRLDIELLAEQNTIKEFEKKHDEICGSKLELEAKHENVLDERRALLDRCLKFENENEQLVKSNAELRRQLDNSNAALHELGLENQSLHVEHVKHLGRKWTEDSEVDNCFTCRKPFSVTVRKHHCRNCGKIFCNDCSAKTAHVASSKNPVRVCDICHSELLK